VPTPTGTKRCWRPGAVASRLWRNAPMSTSSWAVLACPGWASTGTLAPTDRFGRVGHVDRTDHELLHRAVRPEPVHVRKQLPGRQSVVLPSRPVQCLQTVLEELFGLRARRSLSRYGRSRL